MILQILLWITIVEFLGILFLPISAYLFASFKDKGLAISKVLGVLIIGYIVWIISTFKLFPATQNLTIVLLFILFFMWLVWFYFSKKYILKLIVENFSTFIISEVVFIGIFLLFLIFRFQDPSIINTEQPMDFMFLNSVIHTDFSPPEDAWFKGESVNYYYFGYWVFGTLGELIGIKSSVIYNLSLPLISALSSISIFYIVFNVIYLRYHTFKYSIWSGFFSVALLLLVPNSKILFDFIAMIFSGGLGNLFFNPIESFNSLNSSWWWDVSRVIGLTEFGVVKDYTINEFPFFSFIVGDLHPHLMSMPFVLLYIASLVELSIFLSANVKFNNISVYFKLFLMGLILGCVGFINLWDYPFLVGLSIVMICLRIIIFRGNIFRILGMFAIIFSVSFLSILPFLNSINTSNYQIEVFIGPNSNWLQFLSIWFMFFLITLPFMMYFFVKSLKVKISFSILLISIFLTSMIFSVWAYLFLENGKIGSELFDRFFEIIPLYIFIFFGIYSIGMNLIFRFADRIEILSVTLISFTLLLLIIPELIYLDDIFVGGFERMNTVFKLYFQSWVIFSLACGLVIGIVFNLKIFAGGFINYLVKFWGGIISVVLLILCVYTIIAPINKFQKAHNNTLDGIAYLQDNELQAINYLYRNIKNIDGIVEAVGNDYSEYSRISSFTGLPTILGWPGHQAQWRNQAEEIYFREQDVFNIYTSDDISNVLELMKKYDVSHLIVGPREINKYQIDDTSKFGQYMDVVFQNTVIKIFRVRE